MLRLTLALNIIWSSVAGLDGSSRHAISVWAIGSLTIAVGASVLVGFLTPIASTAATGGYLAACASSILLTGANNDPSMLAAFNLAAMSDALVLLGTGA